MTDHCRTSKVHDCPLWLLFLSPLLVSFRSTPHLRSKSYQTLIRRLIPTLLKICRNRSPLPPSPGPLNPAVDWGYPFQNLPSTHVEEPPTAPVIPAALSSKSRKALSDMSGVSGATKYSTPSQTPTHNTGTVNRNRGPPSATSSDDEVSSNLSSDSMSTPPAQAHARRVLTPIYAPAPLPGTGRNAPAPLPPQTPGTGRVNSVNLPPPQPQQQPRDPDGIPPPGVMNELPAPASTMAPTRGRGIGNRGKKRR